MRLKRLWSTTELSDPLMSDPERAAAVLRALEFQNLCALYAQWDYYTGIIGHLNHLLSDNGRIEVTREVVGRRWNTDTYYTLLLDGQQVMKANQNSPRFQELLETVSRLFREQNSVPDDVLTAGPKAQAIFRQQQARDLSL